MKDSTKREAIRTRPLKVGLGCRYSLIHVTGTRWPLIAYHADVLQPLLGPGLATPEIQQTGQQVLAVRYSAASADVDLLAGSTVVEPDSFTRSEQAWLKRKIELLEQARDTEKDRSRRSVLRSFEFPNPADWPNAYRRTLVTDTPIVIVDWGLSQELFAGSQESNRRKISEITRMPQRDHIAKRFKSTALVLLAIIFFIAVVLILTN